jgi:hypothetical protein
MFAVAAPTSLGLEGMPDTVLFHRRSLSCSPLELSLNFGDGLAGQAAAVMG